MSGQLSNIGYDNLLKDMAWIPLRVHFDSQRIHSGHTLAAVLIVLVFLLFLETFRGKRGHLGER